MKIQEVLEEIFKGSPDLNLEFLPSWNEIQTRILVIIQLCQRNSNKMDQDEREVNMHNNFFRHSGTLVRKKILTVFSQYFQLLWFPLLEAMMAPQRQLRGRVDGKYLNGNRMKKILSIISNFKAVETL